MHDFFTYNPALTIEQMAEEAIRKNPELTVKEKGKVELTIARIISSSDEWDYPAERFNYLKGLVDKNYHLIAEKGVGNAKDVANRILEGLTPELAAFLHEQDYRPIERHKKKRRGKNWKKASKGDVKASDEEALMEIIKRYLPKGSKTFDCDLTYGEGRFYDNLPEPREIYDLNPRGEVVKALDVIERMRESKGYSSIVIDLPDMVASPTDNRKKGKVADDLTTFQTLKDLYDSYADMIGLAEFHLAKEGVLVFKAPDILIRDLDSNYENMWTADFAVDIALANDLSLVDEILVVEGDDRVSTGLSLSSLTRDGKRLHVFLIFKKK